MLRALLLVVPVALMLCTGLSTAAATTVGNVCEEDACEADTSMRVVEYFGADWCEPCRPVEAMLDALERPMCSSFGMRPRRKIPDSRTSPTGLMPITDSSASLPS